MVTEESSIEKLSICQKVEGSLGLIFFQLLPKVLKRAGPFGGYRQVRFEQCQM